MNEVKVPVVWIDHHAPQSLDNVQYFNPRKHRAEIIYPVTNICYDIVKQDMWIGMVGCVGDWYLPYFRQEFCEKYPDLLDINISDPGEAIFKSKLGILIKLLEK